MRKRNGSFIPSVTVALGVIAALALVAATHTEPVTASGSPRHFIEVNGKRQAIAPGSVIAVGKRSEPEPGKPRCEFPLVRVGGTGGSGDASSEIVTQITDDCRMVVESVGVDSKPKPPRGPSSGANGRAVTPAAEPAGAAPRTR